MRYETSVDPIELPKLLLTPLALLLNECLTSALEHDFPSEAHCAITVRLEARSEEQGTRRLTIATGGSGSPTDFDSSVARDTSLAFMNAFALQLDGSFRLERDGRGRGRSSSSKQPTSACGAPLWMKMVAARAGLSEPRDGRSC